MNRKIQNQDIPLYLYQVLEEEYESLHGPMREDVTVYLPDPDDGSQSLPVESRRGWDFGVGHIKAPAVFAAALLADAASEVTPSLSASPQDGARKKLTEYLRARIDDDESLRRIRDFKHGGDAASDAMISAKTSGRFMCPA